MDQTERRDGERAATHGEVGARRALDLTVRVVLQERHPDRQQGDREHESAEPDERSHHGCKPLPDGPGQIDVGTERDQQTQPDAGETAHIGAVPAQGRAHEAGRRLRRGLLRSGWGRSCAHSGHKANTSNITHKGDSGFRPIRRRAGAPSAEAEALEATDVGLQTRLLDAELLGELGGPGSGRLGQ